MQEYEANDQSLEEEKRFKLSLGGGSLKVNDDLFKIIGRISGVKRQLWIHIGSGQRNICWFGACFWPFWGCEGVPHVHWSRSGQYPDIDYKRFLFLVLFLAVRNIPKLSDMS